METDMNFLRLKVWTANTNYTDAAVDTPWYETITATFEEGNSDHTTLAVAKMIRGLVPMYRGDTIMVWVELWNPEGCAAGWALLRGFQGRVVAGGEMHLDQIATMIENGRW